MTDSGIRSSFDYFRGRIRDDPSVARDCHLLMHDLGHEALQKYGSFKSATSVQDEMCNSGFTHGVIEANLENSPDINNFVSSTCGPVTEGNFQQWQCFHGIGHGVMYVIDKNLEKSIGLCKILNNNFASGSCVNGVFMEYFINVNHAGQESLGSGSANINICRQQQKEYKGDCYLYAPAAYIAQYPNKFFDAETWCKNAEADYVMTCISGIGSQAMKENITQPAYASMICNKMKSVNTKSCVSGAVSLYINHHASSEAAKAVCNNEFASNQQTCQSVVDFKHKNLGI